MRILLLSLFLSLNAFAVRENTIDADCVRLKGGTCIDKDELGYSDGVTSAIQTQLDAKAATITNSAGLAGQLSDETGSGLAVFGTAPNITNPTGLDSNDVGLPLVDNTSDATKNAASVSLTNKTIDADLNTITNIENADIKAAAAIDATKLADGTVTSTELQYINTLSSNAQTQITAKQAVVAGVDDTEIGYLNGVTSAIQTQINTKVTGPVDLAADVGSSVLPMANGGSDKALTPVLGGVVYTDAGSMEVLAAGTSGQLLKSNGAAAPSWITSSLSDKTCKVTIGGAAVGTACTATCTEYRDSCGTAGLATRSGTGVYAITFAAGTWANNSYLTAGGNSTGAATGVLSSTNVIAADGSLTISVRTFNSAPAPADAAFSIWVEGDAP